MKAKKKTETPAEICRMGIVNFPALKAAVAGGEQIALLFFDSKRAHHCFTAFLHSLGDKDKAMFQFRHLRVFHKTNDGMAVFQSRNNEKEIRGFNGRIIEV